MKDWSSYSDRGDDRAHRFTKKRIAVVILLVVAGVMIAGSLLNTPVNHYNDGNGGGGGQWTCTGICFTNSVRPGSTNMGAIVNGSAGSTISLLANSTGTILVFHFNTNTSMTVASISVVDLSLNSTSYSANCLSNCSSLSKEFALDFRPLTFNLQDTFRFSIYTAKTVQSYNFKFKL